MENVAYLEVMDFDSSGNLKSYVGNGKPVIVMAQGNFCHYCTQSKPVYEKLASNIDNVVFATILIDGEQSEKDAAKFLKKWDPKYRGVPAYLGFDKDGNFKNVHNGGRDAESIKGFVGTI